ncbi:hypothetical protein ACI65C_006867 [Semiaphis heraclei]
MNGTDLCHPIVLNIIVRPQVLPEFDVLIFGRKLNNTQPGQNVTDWAEDGYNDILELHMIALEAEWNDDVGDEVLNQHIMDTNEDVQKCRRPYEHDGDYPEQVVRRIARYFVQSRVESSRKVRDAVPCWTKIHSKALDIG